MFQGGVFALIQPLLFHSVQVVVNVIMSSENHFHFGVEMHIKGQHVPKEMTEVKVIRMQRDGTE